ncbi:MAG: GldG family protein [Methylophagaceae bacterium]
MNINSKIQRQLKLQNIIFYLLLIIVVVLLAKVSLKTNIQSDWTANSRHSLSETSISLLKQLEKDITIQAFISPSNEYRPTLEALLTRYQNHSDKLHISYINPDFSPERVRKLNIQQQGEMIVSLGEQQQHVFDLSEQSLTNALISVSRQQEQWLIFIEGHGERSPLNQANFNLSTWGEQLKQKGFRLQGLNLVEHSQIPNNAAAVIIASPERDWLQGEIDIIKHYIDDGGNLLWLVEPDNTESLASLAEHLGIEFIAGTLLDPNAEMLGISDPQFVLITDYANHPIGQATSTVTLFPQAVALEYSLENNPWQMVPLLTTQDNVWSETGPIDENPDQALVFDLGNDTAGPLNLGILLSRFPDENSVKDTEQRLAIIGDGDFLSNTYIGNAANLELGIALMNWLAEDDSLIAIPVKTTLDNQLELTATQSIIIGLGFLIVIPVLLLSIGLWLWWYRRKQ